MPALLLAIACANLGADPAHDSTDARSADSASTARIARTPGPPLDSGLMPLGGASIDARLADCGLLVQSAVRDPAGHLIETDTHLVYDEFGQRISRDFRILAPSQPAVGAPPPVGRLEMHRWRWEDSCEVEHDLHVEARGESVDVVDLVECDSSAYPTRIEHEAAPGVVEVTSMKNSYRQGGLVRVRIDLLDDRSVDLEGTYEWADERVIAVEWGPVGTSTPQSVVRVFNEDGWILAEEQEVPLNDPADPTRMVTRFLQWTYDKGHLVQFSDGVETMDFVYASADDAFPASGQSQSQSLHFTVQCPAPEAPGQ